MNEPVPHPADPTDQTNAADLFERYAADRRRVIPAGFRLEVRRCLSRLIALVHGDHGLVHFVKMLADDDDAAIEKQITTELQFFASLGQPFEWKRYGLDQPTDLPERLLRRGFVADESEAFMVLPLSSVEANLITRLPVPPDITIRRVGANAGVDIDPDEGLRSIVALQQQVWSQPLNGLLTRLQAAQTDPATVHDFYLAFAGDTPVGSGWLERPQGSAFADLHGGALLPAWRGRGVYSALLAARVRSALAAGVEYLCVDAAPLSRPILQRKGFRFVCETTPFRSPR